MENFNSNYDSASSSKGPAQGGALRDDDWANAKAKVQKVYGRKFVCFAFLINGTCRCPKQSHLGHPEEQRGAFGVNYDGTPPPSESVPSESGLKRQRMSNEDPFTVKRRRLNQGGPLRGEDWDEAKQRVITVYGRKMVCFAFLINGTCRCQEDSRLDHPEEQRGVFGVNFTGKIPRPISSGSNNVWGNLIRPRLSVSTFLGGSSRGFQDSFMTQRKMQETRVPMDSFMAQRKMQETRVPMEPSPFQSPPAPLKGAAWDEAVARVKATFGNDFICFSYLINSTCNCGPGSRFKHPEGEAGAYGVYFQKGFPKGFPKGGDSQYYNPAEDAFYPQQQPSYREPLPLQLPLPIPRPMISRGIEDRMVVRRPGPKVNLRGEEWDDGMQRVKDHFGDKFVCFSYLINGHCKCDGSKKFPHPPGLAGSFGVNMRAENQKCFDFNVNGSCKLQGCPSKHEYWTLDEAITKMRLMGKETNTKERKLARKISAKLDQLEADTPDVTTVFEALRELVRPIGKRSDLWRNDKKRRQADNSPKGGNRTQLQTIDLTKDRSNRHDRGGNVTTKEEISYNPIEDSSVNR